MRRALSSLLPLTLSLALAACAASEPPPPTVPVAPAPPAPPVADAPPPAAPKPPPAPKQAKPSRPTEVPGTSIRFTGGDGSSLESAIVIEGAKGEMDGVRSEYQYLEMLLGQPKVAWTMVQQALLQKDGKKYDRLDVDHGGKKESYYFDITGYFGK
jgi:hypothetical protein